MGLGIYFGTQREYHKYGLKDVYDIALAFAEKNYPNDKIIPQLLGIDYHLQYKVKPQNLYVEEISHAEKIKVIEHKKLNHHKYRFIILPLSFNYNLFQTHNQIENSADNLIIKYDGVGLAEVI